MDRSNEIQIQTTRTKTIKTYNSANSNQQQINKARQQNLIIQKKKSLIANTTLSQAHVEFVKNQNCLLKKQQKK